MLDNDNLNEQNEPTAGAPAPDPSEDAGATGGGSAAAEEAPAPAKKTARKSAAKKSTAKKTATKKTAAKRTTKKAAASEGSAAEAAAEAPAESTGPEGAPDEAPAASEGPSAEAAAAETGEAPAKKAAAKRTTKKAAAKKTAAKRTTTAAKRTTKKAAAPEEEPAPVETGDAEPAPEESTLAAGEATVEPPAAAASLTAAEAPEQAAATDETEQPEDAAGEQEGQAGPPSAPAVLFKAPEKAPTRRRRRSAAAEVAEGDEAAVAEERSAERAGAQAPSATKDTGDTGDTEQAAVVPSAESAQADRGEQDDNADEGEDEQGSGGGRRRRRRGGRRRRKGNGGDGSQNGAQGEAGEGEDAEKAGKAQEGQQGKGVKEGEESSDNDEGGSGSSRRRRRRRRSGEEGDGSSDDPENTVTRVRKARNPEDEITALQGSTRLEAKKQRRREGREAGRRRAPIVSEAEFLARRESVDRVMVIRQKQDLTQIAVLEDKVLVEHYVARESQTSLIGNVYLGRVQNVLPSMEAAFIDIGKGRNAVLYAGEVNWDALGAGNGPRKIEQVLKSGQSVLVQVTKDPIGHKGARLTSQISLPGRFLVYVPDGTTSGISRKLPDTERNRLKTLLKEIVPDSAGVIVRTAAEGASEDELTRDVERLTARWEDISAKSEKGNAPQLLYGEPDLTLKVVRDLFTEDFGKLVVSGDDAWDMVEGYVQHVAPDLAERLERYDDDGDVFAAYRIDEQIAKALDRKVWLPSGGSLIIDRTEAMTVVDVNTGKFTGSGGNLEETVTKNNLEAAEEIVRQLRLRDIGGIIVIDFIDMVLESNRDLVLRRLVECLGRDRTRHQVAEVTSLGLVQMTRKRIGTGLVEAFSEPCEHCAGRGLVIHHEPVEQRKKVEEEPRRGRRGRGRKGEDEHEAKAGAPSPKDVAAMARPEPEAAEHRATDEQPTEAAESAEAGTRAEAAPTAEPAAGESARTEPEPGAEPAPAAEQEETSATGRGARGGRSRRRPAKQHGVPETAPPTPESTSEPTPPAAQPAATGAAASESPAAPEQPEQPEQPESEQPEQPVVPAAPTVVTTSRRRVARRPAGPPSAVAVAANGAGTPAPEGAAPDGTSPDGTAPTGPGGDATGGEQEETETVAAAHVPVKKKGARKR